MIVSEEKKPRGVQFSAGKDSKREDEKKSEQGCKQRQGKEEEVFHFGSLL